jgi:anti-sigma-K factor RskA
MDHQELIDLLPLAALDRLEPEEARALEEHLREGCDQCESELQAWRETAASIALGLEETGSEQRIWERLDARLHANAAAAHSLAQAVSRPRGQGREERQSSPRWWQGVAAVAAAAAVVLLVYNRSISNGARHEEIRDLAQLESLSIQLHNLQSDLDNAHIEVDALHSALSERARLDHVLMAPDLQLTRMAPLGPTPGASGVVAVSRATGAAMVQASGLPPTPAGKTYELWWITKQSGPVRAGLFYSQAGRTAVAPASPPPTGEHVMLAAVTLEPTGGVDKPTGPMYLKGAPERE